MRIFGAQHTDEEAYVVLEYVQGPTLAQVIAGGSLGRATTAHIGAQVADALSFVHEYGVVHRDVKPSNVFVGDDGRTRLSDFGIARHDDDTHMTQTGMVIGTGAYMAPEQVEAREVGAAADIYSLGLVLLECLTGSAAFVGAPAKAALARLARQPDIPRLPAPWPVLLTSMTARDPDRRPPAADVAANSGVRRRPPRSQPPTSRTPRSRLPQSRTPPSLRPRSRPPTCSRSRRRPVPGGAVVARSSPRSGRGSRSPRWRRSRFTRADDEGGGGGSVTTTTTVTTLAPPTTTAAPTTTVDQCTQLQAQRSALDAQEDEIDEILKGKAAQDAKKDLDAERKALDDALKSC